MRKLCACLALLAALALAFAAPSLASVRRYTEYSFVGTLNEDNSVSVVERITADLSYGSHGIDRTLPLRFSIGPQVSETLARSADYNALVRDVSVVADDPWKVYPKLRDVLIRVGDPDREVEGRRTYEFAYTYVMPEDGLADTDFLYYSVLGDGVTSAIDHFSFELKFARPLPQEAVEGMRLFSGEAGGTTNALDVVWEIDADGVRGEASGISPKKAITLFGKLPQGYFVGAATPGELRMAWLRQHLSAIYSKGGLIALILLALLFIVTCALLALLPKPVDTREIEPRAFPPEGLDAAEACLLLRGERQADDGLLALLIDWAGRGIVSLETNSEEHLIATALAPLPEGAPAHQRALYDSLFCGVNDSYDLTGQAHNLVSHVSNARDWLIEEYSRLRAGKWLFYGILALNLLGHMALVCGAFGNGIGVITGLLSLVSLAFPKTISESEPGHGEPLGIVLLFLSVYLLVCGMYVGPVVGGLVSEGPNELPLLLVLPGLALNMAIPLLAALLAHRKPFCVKERRQLRGFERHLRLMSAEELARLEAERPGYFLGTLSYAMAFGLDDAWGRRFDDVPDRDHAWDAVYEHAGRAGAITGQLLHDYTHRVRAPYYGEKSAIQCARAQAEAARRARYSDSGSDFGGGSSGGGGGGGGVSGW